MTTKSWTPTARESEQLFAELGLCLYIYQLIELRLKSLLPLLHVPGTGTHAPGEGWDNHRMYLDSKETLGPLMRRLAERNTSDDRSLFESEWRKLVDHRNEVVHQFAAQPFHNCKTPDEYKQAVEFLRERRLFAQPMYDFLGAFCEQLLQALQEMRRS